MNIITKRNCKNKTKIHTDILSQNRTSIRKKCVICKRTLSSKDALRKHILLKHFKQKPYCCNICKKSFTFERSLILHKQEHSELILLNCFCGQKFKTTSLYEYHKTRKHPTDECLIAFQCRECGEKCADKKQQQYHMKVKHAPKPFNCTILACKQMFASESLLKQHIKTHSSEFKCETCQKSFKVKSYFRKHQKTHEGIRDYSCVECNKHFVTFSHLGTHRARVHGGRRRHLCAFCGATFVNKHDLIYHEMIHTDKKPFVCEWCDYRTISKSSLKKHNKKHEKKNAETVVKTKSQTKLPVITIFEKQGGKRLKASHYLRLDSDTNPYQCIDCSSTFVSAVRVNEHWRRSHRRRKKSLLNDQAKDTTGEQFESVVDVGEFQLKLSPKRDGSSVFSTRKPDASTSQNFSFMQTFKPEIGDLDATFTDRCFDGGNEDGEDVSGWRNWQGSLFSSLNDTASYSELI